MSTDLCHTHTHTHTAQQHAHCKAFVRQNRGWRAVGDARRGVHSAQHVVQLRVLVFRVAAQHGRQGSVHVEQGPRWCRRLRCTGHTARAALHLDGVCLFRHVQLVGLGAVCELADSTETEGHLVWQVLPRNHRRGAACCRHAANELWRDVRDSQQVRQHRAQRVGDRGVGDEALQPAEGQPGVLLQRVPNNRADAAKAQTRAQAKELLHSVNRQALWPASSCVITRRTVRALR